MAEVYGYNREAIRVKVKKCEPNIPPEWRKFSVDPQITSLEVLYSILAKAFDIKSDFSICYKTLDPSGQDVYVSVLSDWDLDAAFLRAHNISIQTGNEPCLNLRVDIKAFSEATDWETSSQITKEIISLHQSVTGAGQKYVQNMQNKLPGLIMNQMEKTFSMVQRALNLTDVQALAQPPRPPLSDSEFRRFLDSVGQILQPNELRKVIFAGGIDPSLRKVVWKHILNVYPTGMTGRERMDYMKKKAAEYYKLRDVWKSAVQKGPVVGELAFVTSMVRKDVLRTDRLHPFYAGSDDNQNIASLFNILTTYALNHPSVSYCQGMSDIASPLLVTMGDEAHAYICFCAVMGRLKANFMLDGIAMTLKFTHLAEALHFYDPEFYDYLKQQQADDLLFCYRWLLLEMKREFAFDDSLRMLEVLWSSLRYEPPTKELDLFEKEFEPSSPDIPPPKSPSVVLRTPRENHYTKVCALRRQSSSASLLSNSPSSINSINSLTNSTGFLNSGIGGSCSIGSDGKLTAIKKFNQSLDENISRSPRIKNVVKAHQSLDETKMITLMDKMSTFKDNIATTTATIANVDAVQPDIVTVNNEEQPIKSTFHPTNPFIDDVDLDELNEQNNAVFEKDKSKIEQSVDKTNPDQEFSDIDPDEGKNLSPKRNSKLNHTKIQKVNNVKLQNKNSFSCNTSSNIISKQIMSKKGGHFKELKEKIAASKKGILASLDKIENQFEISTKQDQNSPIAIQNSDESTKSYNNNTATVGTGSTTITKNQKVVKNFNEFLNFASINKSRISDKMITSNSSNKILNKTLTFNDDKKCIDDGDNRSVVKFNKSSFDDSDSSAPLDTQFQIEQQHDKTGECVKQSSSSSSSTTTTATLINNSKQPLQLHLTNIVAQTQQSLDGSSPDDSQDYYPMTTSMTRELRLELENLDRQVFGDIGMLQKNNFKYDTDIEYEKLDRDSLDLLEVHDEEIVVCPEPSEIIIMRNQDKGNNIDVDPLKRISSCSAGTDIFIWENPLHQISGASSCNFNEIVAAEVSDEENIIKDNCIKELGHIIDGNKNNGHPILNTMTPDEQQELEYDGDIIIECLIQDDDTTKTKKSVALVQTNTSMNSTKMRDCDNSDSDNTDNSNNLNPFSSHYKFSAITPASSTIIMATTDKQLLQQQQFRQTKQIANIFDKDFNKQEENVQFNEPTTITMTEKITAKTSTNSQITAIDDESDTNVVVGFTKVNDILPPPNEFGGGNPFLMFLCLTLLLQHRNYVMKNGLDYNEMAMHFDKMVRKHDVNRVLNQARRMYFEYLKIQNTKQQQQQHVLNSSLSSENYNYNNNNNNSNSNSNKS